MVANQRPTAGDGFQAFPVRVHSEIDERKDLASRRLSYHHSFLDDCLRGILPHDLVLIGAPSGIGKTDLALGIAASNAASGKRVHYFALEAEPRELERRTKFAMLSRRAYDDHHPARSELNYTSWLLGECEHVCGAYNAEIDQRILETLGRLYTYYRGASFDAKDLESEIHKIYERTDLIIVDHLHYIDDDSDNEARSLGDTVKTIRDVSLRIGKPIILVAHLRKRDNRSKQIVATLDDFHGSSNVTKICTQAIVIERAPAIQAPKWFLSPTFITILKDRRAGAPGLTAVSMFDRRTKGYRDEYALGRVNGADWEELQLGSAPSWAHRCKLLERS